MRYVFSNLGQGLRRNLTMHLAVILTLFVSLSLVGFGALLTRQTDRINDQLGSNLEITAFLCRKKDPSPQCLGPVTDPQKQAIVKVVEESPEVASYRFESQQTAFDKTKALFPEEQDRFEGPNAVVRPQDLRESLWITLKDPREFEGITSAIVGLDGVASVRDQRDLVDKITHTVDLLRWSAVVIAVVLGVAALLLVANTIRLAAFARRKEIRIMRLVGASTIYIALPFLLEALVTAVIGVLFSGGALAALQYFGVEQRFSDYQRLVPWVDWHDYLFALVVVAIVGPIITLLPTLLLTRKYIKV
ncbi:permease-like cell division protein FtsX [Nocardioides acrostichi]|uniref:Cell division protein FtsX n=1 Tax=Nocardioides acrostichi TaxID=2784339 RepID=A0A930V248_9ACTN|nr:permease-like cell division protein FtsX [Nocardioides acrostichi]MBF4162330.1 ABC transporter permease [Nocardioides acrostichi]